MREGAVFAPRSRREHCSLVRMDWGTLLWLPARAFFRTGWFDFASIPDQVGACTPAVPLIHRNYASLATRMFLARLGQQSWHQKTQPRRRLGQNGPSSWRAQTRAARGRAAAPRLRTPVAHPSAAATRLDGAPRPRLREMTRHRRTAAEIRQTWLTGRRERARPTGGRRAQRVIPHRSLEP